MAQRSLRCVPGEYVAENHPQGCALPCRCEHGPGRRNAVPAGGGILIRAADLSCPRAAVFAVPESEFEGSPVPRPDQFLIGSLPAQGYLAAVRRRRERPPARDGWNTAQPGRPWFVTPFHQKKQGLLPTLPPVDPEWGPSVRTTSGSCKQRMLGVVRRADHEGGRRAFQPEAGRRATRGAEPGAGKPERRKHPVPPVPGGGRPFGGTAAGRSQVLYVP